MLDGGLASVYGMMWATSMWGIGIVLFFVVPSVANECALSFPSICVWAPTFWMVMLCRNHVNYLLYYGF